MCHRMKKPYPYGDDDIPKADLALPEEDAVRPGSEKKGPDPDIAASDVEPLPESFRERRDGPGGE